MPASRSAPTEPTQVKIVTDAMAKVDDFMRLEDIVIASKQPRRTVRRVLHHLRNYFAVDAVEVNGTLWWFLSPDTDKRIRHYDERKKEDEPRVTKGSHRVRRTAP